MEASGGTALGIEVNVRDHEAVETMMTRVVQEWAGWDVLVANAGGGRGRPMDTKASTLDPALLQLVIAMQRRGTSAPAVTIGGRPLEHARARGQLGQS
jgi:3-oxoacyl-[acyl-carrier protein] reductase